MRNPPIRPLAEDSERPIVVHHFDHAHIALAVAGDLGVPVLLVSPLGFAGYAGPLYFLEMCASASACVPGADFAAVLDCGNAAGDALAALRAGIDTVAFGGPEIQFDRLANFAEKRGARVVRRPSDTLDLADFENPRAALAAWLEGAAK